MRNLLGRLNTRSAEDLQRIARYWQVPLTGDRGRQIGLLYRTMSDIRAARTMMERLEPDEIRIIRELTSANEGALPIAELANRTELDPAVARETAIRLFRSGILAREGDSQELPVGVSPRLFLPRELGLVFRRVQDEIAAGDTSSSTFRVVLQAQSTATIEEAATRWGINVMPGLRSRDELIGQILRQMTAERIRRLVDALDPDARRIWDVMDQRSIGGTLPLADVVREAGLNASGDDARMATRVRDALDQLETTLLVLHTYDREGRRSLFVPQEIRHPGETPATVPMQPLTPLAAEDVVPSKSRHPHALAWDLLTVLREIASHGAPIWVPGEPVSRSWQRRLNGRLWFGGEELPPEGYLGFLLQMGLSIGLLQRTAPPPGTHADRHAIVPVVSPMIREWRSRGFAEQSARLRFLWLSSDEWIEARERGDVDVWGPDWRGFRRKLLESVAEMEPGQWYLLRDLAQRLAETDPALIGTTMTVASSRGGDAGEDRESGRISATALVIRLEFETALAWFGIVETGRVARRGLAVRLTERGQAIAAKPDAVEIETSRSGAALEVSGSGAVVVKQPEPLHIWSMSAFADAELVREEPVFQVRSGSVGRALGAGFDLEHILTYLERHSGKPVPEPLRGNLREWTAGYKRVRLRHATLLTPDPGTSREDLEQVVRDAGLDVVTVAGDAGSIYAVFPPTEGDAAMSEETLLTALRAAGFFGQWASPQPAARKPKTGA
jgi:hypothetical protein